MLGVFKIFDVLDVLVGLVMVIAALVAGVQCRQKNLAAAGAWVLVGSFGLMLVASVGYAVFNLFLADALGSDNYKVYRAIMVLFYVVNVCGLMGVATGIALLKPGKLPAATEVSRG